jgi:hypothetical protein
MTRAWVRGRPGPGQAFLAALGAALLVLGIVGPVAGVRLWTVTADTVGVPLGKTTVVRLTITNRAPEIGGGAGIACVTVTIPIQYKVSAVSVVSATRGLKWSRSSRAPVAASADTPEDRLMGLPNSDRLVLDVTVVGLTSPAGGWTADEFSNANCSAGSDYNNPFPIPMTILALPTSVTTPTPAPTPTATPEPTPEPTVEPTSTPTPTPIGTITPTAAPTGTPAATATAAPGPTQTPASTATAGPGGGGSAGSPGAGGTGTTGAGGPGPSPSPSSRVFEVPAAEPGTSRPFDTGVLPGFEAFDWVVPGVILTGPGLLLIALIAAQAMGALAWLPIVRRRIGAFGLRGRRRSHGSSA